MRTRVAVLWAGVALSLPSTETRLRIYDEVVRHAREQDAVALEVRKSRSTPWDVIVAQVRGEVERADTPLAWLKSLQRFNLSYPNLHAELTPSREWRSMLPSRVRPVVRFDAEWRELGGSATFRVTRAGSVSGVQAGDELIAINGRSMADWSAENFEFCKWPLRGQCDLQLASQFFREWLSWDRSMPLRYTLKRGEQQWDVDVALEPTSKSDWDDRCESEQDRYPGFARVYTGNRACIYESTEHPGVAVLRITSFAYRDVEEGAPIQSPEDEVRVLLPWWQSHANWSHLIVDVLYNGGGQVPVPYYRLILKAPFQEQYAQFRKSPELEEAKLRAGLFWDSEGQEKWFQGLLTSGKWEQTPDRDFLPPVPMFCHSESAPCDQGLFEPYSHPFEGKVSVLVNQHCVSSCDGFVWQMKDKLGERTRLYGHPQAADGNYSRLWMDLTLDPASEVGFKLEKSPNRTKTSGEPLFRQGIAVTRSTDANGVVLDGRPLPMDGAFVPWTLETRGDWDRVVFETALKRQD